MQPPTEEQIQETIRQLKEIKPKIKRYSFFGDDNRATMQAQIEVLEERLDDDDIYERWSEDDQGDIRASAQSALQWMENGETEDGETDLVEGWKGLIP